MPVMGRHSVMLSPDSVRRVTPPTTIMAKTKVEENKSHRPTAGGESTGSGDVGGAVLFAEKNRASNVSKAGMTRCPARAEVHLGDTRCFPRKGSNGREVKPIMVDLVFKTLAFA